MCLTQANGPLKHVYFTLGTKHYGDAVPSVVKYIAVGACKLDLTLPNNADNSVFPHQCKMSLRRCALGRDEVAL